MRQCDADFMAEVMRRSEAYRKHRRRIITNGAATFCLAAVIGIGAFSFYSRGAAQTDRIQSPVSDEMCCENDIEAAEGSKDALETAGPEDFDLFNNAEAEMAEENQSLKSVRLEMTDQLPGIGGEIIEIRLINEGDSVSEYSMRDFRISFVNDEIAGMASFPGNSSEADESVMVLQPGEEAVCQLKLSDFSLNPLAAGSYTVYLGESIVEFTLDQE